MPSLCNNKALAQYLRTGSDRVCLICHFQGLYLFPSSLPSLKGQGPGVGSFPHWDLTLEESVLLSSSGPLTYLSPLTLIVARWFPLSSLRFLPVA